MRPVRRDVCPEAVASETSELTQINRFTVEMVEDLISNYVDYIVEALKRLKRELLRR